ncbi:MAG: cytochrome c peroxidase [Bacteroidota bacterium]
MPITKALPTLLMGLICTAVLFTSCQDDSNELPDDPVTPVTPVDPDNPGDNSTTAIERTFGNNIDINNLDNYANQQIPNYITRDNTEGNQITNAGATLGRVLFYDKSLSSDFSTSCASCHQQQFAFSDPDQLSQGANGITGRHSMRLINARFAREDNFFWDERANSLEEQTTLPIQDHAEMGFSGTNGDPSFADLLDRLEATDYYQELFSFVYGDNEVTEGRIQNALAQFIRSIQSFDSRYDAGRTQVNNNNTPFPNFTNQENQGKQLFSQAPQLAENGVRIGGGLGCQGCHGAPEFDITPNSRNNGVIAVAGNPGATDVNITRSPSLRDLINPNGFLNGPAMHTGTFATIDDILEHYNSIQNVPNLDNRLREGNNGQQLMMTNEERAAITAFLNTLTGNDVYTNAIWSNPFLMN